MPVFRRRRDRFRGYQATVTRPDPLDRFLVTYRGRFSRYPEQVRISFADGTTAVYTMKAEQPAPVIFRREPRRWLGYKFGR